MVSERILFVDDEPLVRRAFSRTLRDAGFVVDLAADGEQAWELASHYPYAVIATDLSLPGMDGMMLIDQLKELQSDPVCLLVTGAAAVKGGADPGVPVIRKPWDSERLVEVFRSALQLHRDKQLSGVDSEPPSSARLPVAVGIGLSADEEQRLRQALEPHHRLRTESSDRAVSGDCFSPGAAVFIASASGQELARWCLRARPRPVVFLTRGAHGIGPAEALRCGAHECLAVSDLTAAKVRVALELSTERAKSNGGELLRCSAQCNPDLLAERVRQALSRARRAGTHAGILLVQVEEFGALRRALGDQGAEAVLQQVGLRLRGCVRESDSVLRLEGERFALLLEDVAAAHWMHLPAWRALSALATPIGHGDHQLIVGATVGAAAYPRDGDEAAALLGGAEAALAQARRHGANTCALPSGELLVSHGVEGPALSSRV